MFLLTCLMTFGHDYRLLFKRLLIRWSDFRYTEKIRNTMLSEDSSKESISGVGIFKWSWSGGILEVTEAKNFLMIKVRLLSFLSLLRGRKGTLFVFYVYETEIHSVKSCTKHPRFVKVTQAKKFRMIKVRLLSFLSLSRGRKGTLFLF